MGMEGCLKNSSLEASLEFKEFFKSLYEEVASSSSKKNEEDVSSPFNLCPKIPVFMEKYEGWCKA